MGLDQSPRASLSVSKLLRAVKWLGIWLTRFNLTQKHCPWLLATHSEPHLVLTVQYSTTWMHKIPLNNLFVPVIPVAPTSHEHKLSFLNFRPSGLAENLRSGPDIKECEQGFLTCDMWPYHVVETL